jgi:hypothetical protein
MVDQENTVGYRVKQFFQALRELDKIGMLRLIERIEEKGIVVTIAKVKRKKK